MTLMLTGCKQELYSNLSEEEANHMVALLMLRDIDAVKTMEKGGSVTISIDATRFADAVEILRQQGLPQKRTETINDLFPSGQLVTSPVQEQAKILYLKEQMLEKMLRSIEGIINAQVSIAESHNPNRRELPVTSASVMIKHTPDVNMAEREVELRRMIQKGIANLRAENISLIMQPTLYRFTQSQPTDEAPPAAVRLSPVMLSGAVLAVLAIAATGYVVLRRRASKRAANDALPE